MSMSVGAMSSAQIYSPLFQSQSADASNGPDDTDPLTALLQAASAPSQANQPGDSASSQPPAGSSTGARFSSDNMDSLLSVQSGQGGGGSGGTSGGASGANGSDGSGDSSSSADGATTVTTTNPDGSTTTTTTFQDGTVQTATTAATPSSSASNGAAQGSDSGDQSDAGQLVQMLTAGMQALAPAAALLAVI